MNMPDSMPSTSEMWRRLVLYLSVAITGGAVMVLELLGTRIIGPFYGVSLYVWSSLIAVTMIALATGYYLGGWCADHLPRLRLAHLLVLSATATLLIPLVSGHVLTATDAMGMKAGAFVSAMALFLVPLTCLGMVGPLVIKLATQSLDGVGTAAGSVYAVSTIGSVLSTLGLGFYLLPVLGTRSIIEGTGVLLMVLGAGFSIYERNCLGRRQVLVLALVAAGGLAALAAGILAPVRVVAGFPVLQEAESTYGWVRVVDDESRGIRLLLSDASSIGAVRIDNGHTMLGYQEILTLLPLLKRQGSGAERFGQRTDALLVGLGAGYVATELWRQGVTTDTIEIDPAVARAAQDHFGFKPTGRFLVGDGRYEIRQLHKRYDLIIHDCFTGGAEPTHLLTREMITQLKALMNRDGVLALNFVGFSRGEGAEAVASVSRTLGEVFRYQRVFMTVPDGEFSDYVFLVSSMPIEFSANDLGQARVLAALDRLERSPPSGNSVALTDDFNPLEYMQGRKAELYRTLFIERVSPALLLR